MAQHDLDIATGDANTGASIRTELNLALVALGTLMSGSTPAITHPNMLWADTSVSPKLLKKRLNDDSGWIVIGELDTIYLGLAALSADNTFTGDNTFDSDTLILTTAKTPASAGDTGTKGHICWDANYMYVCVATDTWKRVAIATW